MSSISNKDREYLENKLNEKFDFSNPAKRNPWEIYTADEIVEEILDDSYKHEAAEFLKNVLKKRGYHEYESHHNNEWQKVIHVQKK